MLLEDNLARMKQRMMPRRIILEAKVVTVFIVSMRLWALTIRWY